MSDKVVIFDTTLRDGEQSPGISLDPVEKLEIAEQLARLGVDYIEAGFPVASQGDFEAVQAIARTVDGPVIAALSRTQLADVDRCYEALRDADRNRIHVFISTSPSHMEHMLKMNEAQVLEEVRHGVARAREHTDDVEFSPQDATRTPLDFMLEVLAAAVESGATTLNIPDTVGYGIPWDFGDLIAHVREQIAGDYVISTHCHNDLGLAVANSLSGVRAGARQVEVCVNGLGERAGNAALEEVVMALKIRPDQFPGLDTERPHRGARPDEPAGLAPDRLPGPVEQGRRGQERLRPRVGHPPARRARGARRPTRSSTPPRSARWAARSFSASTRAATPSRTRLEKLGITARGDALNAAFARFKELADRKVQLTDADLEAIVAEELGTAARGGLRPRRARGSGRDDRDAAGESRGQP